MGGSVDWTGGPAKWAAVAVLGAASVAGMTWSIAARQPRAAGGSIPRPALVESRADGAVRPGVAAAAPEAPSAQEPPPPGPVEPAAAARKININTASSAELELLPGIGPALAGRIIEYRTASGAFGTVDQLDEVKGIGPRTLERLRPLVRVE